MTRCYLFGAGASYGYDESLQKIERPPLTSDVFKNSEKLGFFSRTIYPELYGHFETYVKSVPKEQAEDIESYMEWLVDQFENKSDHNADFQRAIGQMWFLLYELLRHYSIVYTPTDNNYHKLALHNRREQFGAISLNYDVLLESAIVHTKGSYHYVARELISKGLLPENAIPIAKIHGSINWLIQLGNFMSFGERSFDWMLEQVAQLIFSNTIHGPPMQNLRPDQLVSTGVRQLIQSGDDYRIPMILPPLGNKKDYNQFSIYTQAWELANSLLREASEIVIIGTKLREKDERLCKMISTQVKEGTKIIAVGSVKTISERLEKILTWKPRNIEPFNNFTAFANTL